MKQKEARKLFDMKKFKEITEKQFWALNLVGEFKVNCEDKNFYLRCKP